MEIAIQIITIANMEIAIQIMAITMLIVEVICAFHLQTMAERMKCNDSAKRETQELGMSPM
jgi:hypothetical protein